MAQRGDETLQWGLPHLQGSPPQRSGRGSLGDLRAHIQLRNSTAVPCPCSEEQGHSKTCIPERYRDLTQRLSLGPILVSLPGGQGDTCLSPML